MTANKLVRVLTINLRPEIRHEILNLDGRTVSELRKICKRREAFLADVRRCSGYMKDSPLKRDISEVCQEIEDELRSTYGSENDIEAFSLVCWNYRAEGHRYQECLAERRVVAQQTPINQVAKSAQKTSRSACRCCQSNRRLRMPHEINQQ